jgi:hypothetical protein
MATFDSALNPYDVTNRNTPLQQNVIPGWIPGEIVDVADEHGIGRVKVRSELLAPNTTLPNAENAYVVVMEDFVTNNALGGSHRFLQRGSQVALLPMLGDPTQLLLLGCIPSIVDRPSPEFDRDKGIYGQHTPGQVYRLHNDGEGSSIDVRPSGAIQHVSGGGDITLQTRDGARQKLHADGTLETQNNLASQVLHPDGTIQTKNAAQGSATLKTDGSWEFKSSSEAALNLVEGKAELSGPLHPISEAVKDLGQKLPVALSTLRDTLGNLTAAFEKFKLSGDFSVLTNEFQPLLKNFEGIKASVEGIVGSVKSLNKVNPDDLAGLLMPQVENFLGSGLSKVSPLVSEAITKFTNGTEIVEELQKLIPPELQQALKLPDLKGLVPVLDGLKHNKPAQTQYVLDAIAPGGLSSIQGLVGLDLHDVIDDIHGTLSGVKFPDWYNSSGASDGDRVTSNVRSADRMTAPTFQELQSWETTLQGYQDKLKNSLPDKMKGLLSDSDLQGLVNQVLSGGNPMDSISTLLAKVSSGSLSNLIPQAEKVLGFGEGVPVLSDLIGSLTSGGDLSSLVPSLMSGFPGMPQLDTNDLLGSAVNMALPFAMTYLTGGMGPAMEGLIGSAGGILGLFGKNKGGVIRLSNNKVEAKASQNGLSAGLEIVESKAALQGIGGMVEVFAGKMSAGVTTPWGGFGFGSAGGSFLSQAQMAMRVFQDVGKSAGVLLHPKSGASIASFEDSDFQSEDTDTWQRKSAEVTVDDGHVLIRSYRDSSGIAAHGIDVAPSGVYIEGIRVYDLWNYYQGMVSRLDGLESRFATLSAASPAIG